MKRIKKVSQTVPTTAQVVDGYSTSTTDSPSCNFVNGTTLYSDNTGTTGTVTLSESVANYRYVEIYFKSSNDLRNGSIKLETSQHRAVLQLFFLNDTTTQQITQQILKDIEINGTSITVVRPRIIFFTSNLEDYSNATVTQSKENTIYIYKVIGYK